MPRRYALLGWLVWQVGKRMARKRARALVSSPGKRRPGPAAIVPALVALAAAVWFLFFRRKDGGDGAPGDE